MDEHYNSPFMNYFNSSNIEENSSSQNSTVRPTQYAQNFSNTPYVPQLPHNFQIPRNFPMNPSNAPRAPFYMYPHEYFSMMGNQFFMPPPPYGFHPPDASAFLSDESRRVSTDKESATPSSIPESSFPPHSSPFGLENITIDKDTEMGYEEDAQKKKKTTWSLEEDKVLARSWISVSTDPVIGNAQKEEAIWKRITEEYNEHRPTSTVERQLKQVKSHFFNFQRLVSEFSGIYNKWHNNRASGWSDDDILTKAHKEWMSNKKNKPFKYEHVWRILRECEKYAPQSGDHRSGKKARTSESGAYTSSSNPDTSVDVDDYEVRTRPIGQKAAKRKGKTKSTIFEDLKKKMEKTLGKFTEYSQRKLDSLDTANENKKSEAFQREYDILMRDTVGMTEEQLRIHSHACQMIKKKWGLE